MMRQTDLWLDNGLAVPELSIQSSSCTGIRLEGWPRSNTIHRQPGIPLYDFIEL